MNVYDFDDTIYDGDSTLDFYKFCLRRQPGIALCLPQQLMAFMKYKFGMNDKTQFKAGFYCFLRKIEDADGTVKSFWDENEGKIKKWYLEQQAAEDVIISASPFFLLKEICNRQGIKSLIASHVDPHTGIYSGVNCYGEEKVRRFQTEIQGTVENFYTDSESDAPMLKLAENGYLIQGDNKVPWREEEHKKKGTINYKKMSIAYFVFLCILMLVYCFKYDPMPIGEWDDYTLPIASILNDQNFSINASDIVAYKKLFPAWAQYIDTYLLSGFMAKDGAGQLTWYFPVYAIVCLPFVVLFDCLSLPTTVAIWVTNLASLMISWVVLFKYLKCDDKVKFLLLVMSSLNPIWFYAGWISGEALIYSTLLIALVFWYNRNYKRAAFFVSVAGMFNTVIMSIGLIMILEYVYGLMAKKDAAENWQQFIKKNIWPLIKYGCCYIIGLFPLIYNYYHTGHINLTATVFRRPEVLREIFHESGISTVYRFFAYLLDLNFGILPYYPIAFGLSFLVLIAAVVLKHWRYVRWMAAFLLLVALYSLMPHINCGMSGIARYNAWGALPLIFAVVLFGEEIAEKIRLKNQIFVVLSIGALITTSVVVAYHPHLAKRVEYISFSPLAAWVLDHAPALYNPLPSTFISRTVHVDGGYNIVTPIVYEAKDGYVRKILASGADKERLLKAYSSRLGDNEWFERQVNSLGAEISYISVPKRYMVEKASDYIFPYPSEVWWEKLFK